MDKSSQNGLRLIKGRLLELSPMHFKASLLMKPKEQFYFCGAYLFHFEMRHIAESVQEETLRLIRFEWWRGELTQFYAKKYSAMPPALRAFFKEVQTHFPVEFWLEWLAAYEKKQLQLQAAYLEAFFMKIYGLKEPIGHLLLADLEQKSSAFTFPSSHPLFGLATLLSYYAKQLARDPDFFKKAFYRKAKAPSFIFYLLWEWIKKSRLSGVCSPFSRFLR